MAFYFNSLIASSTATTQAASTFILNTDDRIDLSLAVVDQEALQSEINDAVSYSVQDIVDDVGPLGGILEDVNGEFGQYGDLGNLDLGGAGGIAESIGGIAMPDRIDSAADLLGWAEGMMDPNRVDTGSTNGDPLRQSGGSRDMPGNVNVNGGGGEGLEAENHGGLFAVKMGAGEEMQWKDKSGFGGIVTEGSVLILKPGMTLSYTKTDEDGNIEKKDTLTVKANGGVHVVKVDPTTGTVIKTTDVPPPKAGGQHKSEGEGEGGGGIDGGNTPIVSGGGDGAGDFQGDLGEIYINIGIGTSGGDGQVNSSLEDFLDAIGGVTPSGAPANEGGQGEGADGNTDGGPVLPPFYIEHHANLIGAMIDPIPYII
jgi:hypothetical protein